MKCFNCGHELIIGGQHDYEDLGVEGEGIVTNLSCPECGEFVEVYDDIENDVEIKGENNE